MWNALLTFKAVQGMRASLFECYGRKAEVGVGVQAGELAVELAERETRITWSSCVLYVLSYTCAWQ
jgi:hypothetical protein